ncbi:MAG: bifunctional (p)ppGpp synthetase/guanosine-3',5'-bis(diphosphate) 3'-pyrophosphohydrolase [Candidatus Moranbacteria bacterium]|nr:bifunctional (p)ppGpp synthetase/guanosine-3',5'-bis(diphosphate) 3'-pyrophosphohydrolase [Candidatus Moranbacteria bacterium]
MFLTPKIEKAIVRATVLHQSQKRKVSGVPYIVHPYSVAFLLAHYTDDEDVIIAGLLHDTLEDIPEYTEEMLREEFGERACAIVKEVTEDFTQAEKEDHSIRGNNWRARKEKYLANLSNDSKEALLVATADKIHNMRSALDEYRIHGDSVWEKFKRNADNLIWFYTEAAKVINEHLDHPLVEEMNRLLLELQATAPDKK